MKPIRTMLIRVSLLAIAIGFLLSLVALAGMKFDFSRLSTQAHHTVTHSISQPFSSIRVDVTDCMVRFVPSDGDTCRVDCPESSTTSYSVFVAQDALTITEENQGAWYHHIGIDLTPKELVVYLPQQSYQRLELKTVSGNASLPQEFSFADASISTTSGSLQCSSAVSGDASVETVSGDVDISGWTPQSLQIRSTSADVRLAQVVVAGSCRVEAVSGAVELTGCDADSLDINTISGNVSATLHTGKTFSVESVSGEIRIPPDTSGGLCRICTVSGNITCTIQ